MRHFTVLPLLGFLFSYISLSWAQNTSSTPLSSGSLSPSSTSSLNSSLSVSLTSSAQFPTLSGYSPCVTNCLAVGVARVNCSSITDVNCYCSNSSFAGEVFACIEPGCPTEVLTEEKLAQLFCNLASSSPTLTFPSITPSSTPSSLIPTSTSSLPQSTPSSTTTPSSDATLNLATVSFSTFLAILVYPLVNYLL